VPTGFHHQKKEKKEKKKKKKKRRNKETQGRNFVKQFGAIQVTSWCLFGAFGQWQL
jgi:hypothetical protein